MFQRAKFDASLMSKFAKPFAGRQLTVVNQSLVGLREGGEHCNSVIPSVSIAFRVRRQHTEFEPRVELMWFDHDSLSAANGRFL
jgi:hypothetical protein